MVLGFLSLKGGLVAFTSKAAIGVALLAGIGGAAIVFIPPQADDVAIWFDQPTMHQAFYPGEATLTVHVGRGNFPKQVRIDVKSLDFPDQPGQTLATKDIAELKGKSGTIPATPIGLFTASLTWMATPGTYRLLPSFDGTKGHYVTVTVTGLPKSIATLPKPGASLTPSPTPTPSATPSETPSENLEDLGPDGGDLGSVTPNPEQTLPPPPEPVTPPFGLIDRALGDTAGDSWVYRFTGSAIVPGSALARVYIRRQGDDNFVPYYCGPLTADPLDSNKRTCVLKWQSGARSGYALRVEYYFKVTANGQDYTTSTESFLAGRVVG